MHAARALVVVVLGDVIAAASGRKVVRVVVIAWLVGWVVGWSALGYVSSWTGGARHVSARVLGDVVPAVGRMVG